MTHGLLIVPIGPPGCGKSTFARTLLEAGVMAPDAIVSPDDLRLMLTGARSNQHRNAEVFAIANMIAGIRLSEGLPVYYDATNVSVESLHNLRSIIVRRKAKIICVRFDVSPGELRERNATREHPVPADVLEKLIADFDKLRSWHYPGEVLTPEAAMERLVRPKENA